jgi:serine/threonine-protein kinase
MGAVYEAEQRMGLHVRSVAVKTLLPALSGDPTVVSRFYRECGTVAQLEHPNTIRFYDFGQTEDGILYIVMELVRGEALSSVIARGALPLERVVKIARQLCGALHEAHELGIVHRDLKPDNVLLTTRAGETDFAKLLDFGIAARSGSGTKLHTKLTQQGMVLGTPPYMSPEQLAGAPVDRRSDLYSLGVVLYEMLSGKLPFEAESPWEWAYHHMMTPPRPLPSTVPRAVANVIVRALAKNAAQRPATALELFEQLADAAGEPASDDLPPSIARARVEPTVFTAQGPRTSPLSTPPAFSSPYEHTERVQAVPDGAARQLDRPSLPASGARARRRRHWLWSVASILTLSGLTVGVVFISRSLRPTPSADVPVTEAPAVSLTPEAGASFAPQAGRAPRLEPTASTPPRVPPRTQPATRAKTPTAKPRAEQPPPVSVPTTPPAQSPSPPAVPPLAWPDLPLPVPTTPAPPVSTQPAPPAPTPPPTPPQPAPTEPAPKPNESAEPTGNAACDRADSLAQNEAIEAAVAMYRRCTASGGGQKAQNASKQRIRYHAQTAVKHRSLNGDCTGARSAARAAASIGAGDLAAQQLAAGECRR